jgi:hypothetical protein
MNAMTFREAVDIRMAQLQGRPVDAAQLTAALEVIGGTAAPRPGKPFNAAAAVVCGDRLTLAP